MPFCPFCGSATEKEDRFCAICGGKTPDATPIPPVVGPKKSRLLVALVITLFLCTGLAVTIWRLQPYIGLAASQRLVTTIALHAISYLYADPIVVARQVQNKTEKVTSVVLGQDDTVGSHNFCGPQLTDSMQEVEQTDKYRYMEKNCTDLFSDVAQQAALAVASEVATVSAVSAEEENLLGKKLAKVVAHEHKGKLDRSEDLALQQYVGKIGLFLTRVARRKGIDWEFHVIKDDSFNAFALPGGEIYVNTGLLAEIENEAQLAGVLAHEIAHVDLRHCIAVYQVLKKTPKFAENMTLIVANLITHPFHGRMESEADRHGLEQMYEVGYSPAQVVRLWEKQDDGRGSFLTVKQGESGDKRGLLGIVIGQAVRETANVINDHPDAARRACLLRNQIVKLHRKEPRKLYYVGRWNLQARIPFFEETK